MLFMVIEHFKPGRAEDVYRRFRDHGRMAPAGLRYVDSWVDLDFHRCYQVMEAENAEQLSGWTRNWEDIVEFEVIPVRTSAEASAVIRPRL